MKYSVEKGKEHLAMVRKVISARPDASGNQIKETLIENGYKFDIKYIQRLVRKIANERRVRYDRETKNEIVARFEDFVKGLEPQLRKLSTRGEKDTDKINAIKVLVDNYKSIIEMQMDLGVLERNLGTVRSEGYHFDIVKIAKMIEEVNKQKADDRRKDNRGSDAEQRDICK